MSRAARPRAPRRWWLLVAGVASAVTIGLGSVDWYRTGTLTFTGRQVTGDLVPVLGYAALALVVLTLTLKGRGRRVAAVALFTLGVGEVVTGWTRRQPTAERIAEWGASGAGAPTTAWVWLAIAGVATGAAAVGFAAPGDPSGRATPGDPSARFERRRTTPADPNLAAWRAMDAGLDPTAEPDTGYPSDAERDSLSRSRSPSADRGPNHDERGGASTKHQRKGRDA